MTITTALASEVHAANSAGDVFFAMDLVLVQSIIILAIHVTDFAVVMFFRFVTAKVLEGLESSLAVGICTRERRILACRYSG